MRKILFPISFLVLSIAPSACSRPADANVVAEKASAGIVGGARDTGDPAVVIFNVAGHGGGDCTAVFVATTVLLTAAHCVLDDSRELRQNAQYRLYTGDDYSQVTDNDWIYVDPSDVHPHPSYDGHSNDISVLVLRDPISVRPFAFNTQALPSSDVGQSVRLVGYGSNVAGSEGANDGFGRKRQLTTTIDDIDDDLVHIGDTGANGCDGDSGGPALLTIESVETIIALDSFSEANVNCTGGDYYQRVDTVADFIAQFMPPDAPGPDNGAPGNDGHDPSSGGAGASSDPGSPSSDPSADGPAPSTPSSASRSKASAHNSPPGCAASPLARDATGAPAWAALIALFGLRRRKRRTRLSGTGPVGRVL
jgi:hypothetical protein